MSIMHMQLDTGGTVGVAVKPAAPAAATATPPVEEAPELAEQPLVVQSPSLQASFFYDQQLNQVIITLTSPETGEVVRRIPDEHMQHFIVGMMELAGKLFDARV
ncbi:MAG: flagellar protein FlaG [Armatimonadota bacterium]